MDRSCGGGRTAGGPAMLRIAWCLLLARPSFGFVAALAPRAAITITAIETVATVEAPAAALITIAISVGLAQHRRGTFLVLVDAHREVAQHVFRETLLPLDFADGRGRRVELEQGEMRLAVLADAVGERLDPPVFRVADQLAAETFDDALEVGRHFLDLLRAQILARHIDVFVQWHGMPFPVVVRPAPSPSCPLGKARKFSGRREHGTPDHAVLPALSGDGRPFSSRPGSSGERGL